jgi:hypothetical protein
MLPDIADSAVLYRPVGQAELDLIRDADWRRFPPRLAWQPIFYPVVYEDYAVRIARDWNTRDPNSGHVGYVTRFAVRKSFLDLYETHQVGGRQDVEYWIPAEDLEAFNDNLASSIEIIHEFHPYRE